MNIVPKTKCDLEACVNLAAASDAEVMEVVPSLLEWIQDLNWPVADKVAERLIQLDQSIDEYLLPILRGDDEIWKYSILVRLLTDHEHEFSKELTDEIIRIVNQPTDSEKAGEVDLAAKDVVFYINYVQDEIA